MNAQQLCQVMLSDYERQWAEAKGHQERHPLRAKMELLRELSASAEPSTAFTALLDAGLASDDPLRAMLCAELKTRWERLRAGER